MFEQYIIDLRHDDAAVRYDAAQKLGALGDRRAVEYLTSALSDASAKVQYAAFSSLLKLGATEAATDMVDALLARPNSRLWDLIKLNIGMRLRHGLVYLAQTGDMALAERCTAALERDDLDEQQRALFVRLLGRTGDLHATPSLLSMLDGSTETMQVAAIEALGWLRDASVVSPLIMLLTESDRETLREVAAEALGRIGSSTAYDSLIAALNDDSEWVRRAAAVSLGELGDHRAVEPLSEALRDPSTIVQDAAFESLKKLSFDSYTTSL